MAAKLRGLILSINSVLVVQGQVHEQRLEEIGQLIKFLLGRGITPVVLSNHAWNGTFEGKKTDLQEILTKLWGKFPWFIAGRDGTPWKPRAEATAHVLSKMGWDATEALYLGNTEADMQTAVNGSLLFLNATWYGKNCEYGFEFASTRDVARFIDLCCLRESSWHFTIEDGPVRYYALAPYSTYIKDFAVYSTDAKNAAKFGAGHPDFWTKYLFSTIYFAGLHKEFSYIAPYPSHKSGYGSPVMDEPMATFAACFRKTYLPDLIVRHTASEKSAFARAAGKSVDVLNQLNTIHLTDKPLRGLTETRYKARPIRSGKRVLIVDDICTAGYSLEAARSYVEQTGAQAILLSWLKTVNTGYSALKPLPKFDPYKPQSFKKTNGELAYSYKGHIVDGSAPEQIAERLKQYDAWKWPA